MYCLITQLCTLLLDLVAVGCLSDHQKHLELLLLRQHLRILQRQRGRSPRIFRTEQLILAVLTATWARLLTDRQARLGQIVLLFKPATVVKWHRELVRRKWTFRRNDPLVVHALLLRLRR